jgi:ribose transport system substrate-binding protein
LGLEGASAIGAQLPYGLGIAEANAAAYALLGKPVPPYISLPAVRVKKANGLSALELVTKKPVPAQVREACRGSMMSLLEAHRCRQLVAPGFDRR